MSNLLKKLSVSGITVETKILSKNAEYWVMRSPMGFARFRRSVTRM